MVCFKLKGVDKMTDIKTWLNGIDDKKIKDYIEFRYIKPYRDDIDNRENGVLRYNEIMSRTYQAKTKRKSLCWNWKEDTQKPCLNMVSENSLGRSLQDDKYDYKITDSIERVRLTDKDKLYLR